MWFKNLLPYRLAAPWTLAPGALEEQLANRPLLPCSGLSAQSQGWVSPRDDGALVCSQGKQMLIALGVETKILPASVVKEEAEARAAEQEARMGFKPGRKQMRELKEQITAELLPKAFAKRQITRAWINPESGWLIVDTASVKRGDDFTTVLRETLGTLQIEPMDTVKAPVTCMTQWLAANQTPGNFQLDQDCEMKSGGDDPAAIRFARHGLEGDDVRRHVKDGKSVTQLGLTWNDRMRLVLADPGVIKRVRFDMIEQDRAEHDTDESAEERFDADFTLMCGELSAMLAEMIDALGGMQSPR